MTTSCEPNPGKLNTPTVNALSVSINTSGFVGFGGDGAFGVTAGSYVYGA